MEVLRSIWGIGRDMSRLSGLYGLELYLGRGFTHIFEEIDLH